VQIIFAGQAHPRDDAGKELIKQIVALSRRPEFRRRLAIARSMTQGADVWLSTPRRPLEASGTSGMKAAADGVLNLSTLDGWWDESWDCELRIADCRSSKKNLRLNPADFDRGSKTGSR
jgi:starch phosphorylase